MDPAFDPNVPDCTNGDYFCKLCLSSMNSEQMWSSHIVGKRHIKNVQKFPNGLPSGKRFLDDGEDDSCDMPAKYPRYADEYDWGHNYPPPSYPNGLHYEKDYYHHRPPIDYMPAVKPEVVIDYGHTKKLEEPPLSKPKEAPLPKPSKSDVVPPGVDVDEVLKNILKNSKPQPKDDFFEKINQREMAKDIAKELAKKCFYSEKVKEDTKKESESKSESKSSSKSDGQEKFRKKKSVDILDIFHKQNDERLFKISDEKEKEPHKSRSSDKTTKKSKSLLDKLNPDELTPDLVDDLLSAELPKKKATIREKRKLYAEKAINTDESEIFESLPTMTFLELVQKKLKSLELKNSEELKMVLRVYFEVEAIVNKKLSPELRALVKGLLSGTAIMQNEKSVHNSPVPQNQSVAPAVSSVMNPQFLGNSTITSTPSPSLNSYVSAKPAEQKAVNPIPSPVQNCSVPQMLLSVAHSTQVAQINSLLCVPPPPPPPPPPVLSSLSVATPSVSQSSVPYPTSVSYSTSLNQPTVTRSTSGTNVNQQTSEVNKTSTANSDFQRLQSFLKVNKLSSSFANWIPSLSQKSKEISSQQPVPQLKQQSSVPNCNPHFSKDVVDALQKLQTLSDEFRKTNQPANIGTQQNQTLVSNQDRTLVTKSVPNASEHFKTNPSQQSVHQSSSTSRQQLPSTSNSDTYFSKKMIEELFHSMTEKFERDKNKK